MEACMTAMTQGISSYVQAHQEDQSDSARPTCPQIALRREITWAPGLYCLLSHLQAYSSFLLLLVLLEPKIYHH